MPGLLGIVGEMRTAERARLMRGMATDLKRESWHDVHLYVDDHVGLGRVSLGVLNPEPQPIWNEDHTLCIVMEGEVYDHDRTSSWLTDQGHRLKVNNAAEFLLHLYEELEEDFVAELNGTFVAAIWDVREDRLLLVNDRLGQRHLFYAQSGDTLLFASSVGAILRTGIVSREVDLIAMAEFLTFEHVLDDKTLARNVALLPPASLMEFRAGRLTRRQYWDLSFDEGHGVHNEAWYVNRWIDLMRQSVERRTQDQDVFGIMLSGGMDSRAILGALNGSAGAVRAFTFGVPGCDDVRFAHQLARRLNVDHHHIDLKPDYLLALATEGVRLTDGMNNCIHMHNLAAAPEVRQSVRIVFTGNLGDDLMADRPRRGYSYRVLPSVGDWDNLVGVLFRMDNSCFPVDELPQLFADDCYERIEGVVQENHRAVLSRADTRKPGCVLKYWEITQRVRRFVLLGQVLLRDQVEVRGPFYDNDLVAFMLTVPSGLRLDGYLYGLGLITAYPELAKVPLSTTGLPMVACFRNTQEQFARQLRWRLRDAGLTFVAPPNGQRPYADYDGWMRTTLRRWVEDTLLDQRALGRGYFNPDYVRNLVAEQLGGANHACKLGGLLSLELWHRLFVD